MSSQQEYDSLRIQPIEYPDGSNHLPEVHESNHLPEVHESNHPPKTPEYRPAPAADIMEPGDIYQHRRISENRNPFGLGPLAFGAIIALITALVVGAAVGGAVGGALARKKEECEASSPMLTSSTGSLSSTSSSIPTSSMTIPTSSTSSTSTALINYTAPEPSLVQSLHINCPELDGTIIEDPNSDQYRVTCGQRILGNPSISRLSALVAYSLQDCIQACFLLNEWVSDGEYPCRAVTWCKAMSDSVANDGANCWLFNSSTNSLQIEGNYTAATNTYQVG